MKGSTCIFVKTRHPLSPGIRNGEKVFSSFYVYLLVYKNKYLETKRKIEKRIGLDIHYSVNDQEKSKILFSTEQIKEMSKVRMLVSGARDIYFI